MSHFTLVTPRFLPPLDPEFRPPVLANHAFRAEVAAAGGVPLVLGLEAADGTLVRYTTPVFAPDHPRAAANLPYVERLVKFLLWQVGGWRLYVGGPRAIAEALQQVYAPTGARAFDDQFMTDIYERPFTVVSCAPEAVPPARLLDRPLGRHLEGCRIGFDLGASDRKASAVIEGEPVYSEEVIWAPRDHADPEYHYRELRAAIHAAAAHLPRVDAIGGSSAGVIINNRPMVASLFRGVPPERYGEIRSLFLRIGAELSVPIEVANDGDVTALAGSMSLEANGVLGIALGSSEAAGYVNAEGNITGWLNELAFAPVDYNPDAPVEEWSGDRGCGASYFSQQAVFRLAPRAGIALPDDAPLAEKLQIAQEHLEAGHAGARQIWESLGVYLGYSLAHYADFYSDCRHVLILGRCTSGSGGEIIVREAHTVLQSEFPELAEQLHLHLPDEKTRRVGQAIAAASLPAGPRQECQESCESPTTGKH
ncbi:MAG TPA: ROK family protein [Anaerolineae bacterium]|nr:ROK family protein [Anaerolineae bacterium]HQM13924.1 ROK family protein [Anaerolineae bacterium]